MTPIPADDSRLRAERMRAHRERLHRVKADRWAGNFPIDCCKAHGILLEPRGRNRKKPAMSTLLSLRSS